MAENSYNDEIHLEHAPGVKHKNPLFRDGWMSMIICGTSGCGKTSLMAQLVPGISDTVKFITIASRVKGNDFHLAVKKWAESKHMIYVWHDDPIKLAAYIEALHDGGFLIKDEQEMLLIFDDFAPPATLSKDKRVQLVVRAFTTWRNYGLHLIVVCQNASMVPQDSRNCLTLRMMFESDARPMQNFRDGFIGLLPDKDVYHNLEKYVCCVPWTYICYRKKPLEIGIGKGTSIRKVMDQNNVDIPTYNELMKEIGAVTPHDLDTMTMKMQKKIGNTAPELNGKGFDLFNSSDSSDSSNDEF
jgi:hypothetical protein